MPPFRQIKLLEVGTLLGVCAVIYFALSSSAAALIPSSIAVVTTENSAIISWKTGVSTPTHLVYGTSLSYGADYTEEAPTTEHKVLLSSLLPNTPYVFYIVTPDSLDQRSTIFSTFYTTTNQQMAKLQADIARLKLRLGQAAQAPVQAQPTVSAPVLVFSRNLKLGDTGEDVRQLQRLLNSDSRTQVSLSGVGSKGNETTTYGPATARAVSKFQELYSSEVLKPAGLSTGTGVVGNLTRGKLNMIGQVGGIGSAGASTISSTSYLPGQAAASNGSSFSPATNYSTGGTSSAGNSTSPSTPSVPSTPGATSYTITASAGAGGTISPSGVSSVSSGGSKTYTITPNSGYQISSLSVDGLAVTSASSYTFSNVAGNRSIAVGFSVTTPVTPTTPVATPTPTTGECFDGIDNDGDGLVDANDNKGTTEGKLGVSLGCFGPNQQETVTDYGWTMVTKSTDTQIIYVSDSTGDDSNDGLTPAAPKKTAAAGYAALRNGYPDWLLFKAGDSWNGGNFVTYENFGTSGRSDSEKLVISRYGAGANPRLVYMKFWSNNSGNIALMHLKFDVGSPTDDFIWSGVRFGNSYSNILIEGVHFARGGININAINNLKIRNSVIVDAWGNGLGGIGAYFENINGLLLENNLFDENGWEPGVIGRAGTTHNTYIHHSDTGVVVRNNIFARGSNEGNGQRPGGINDNNLYLENPVGLIYGYTAAPLYGVYPSGGSITRNVFLDAVDLCGPTCPRGAGITINNYKNLTISDNIFAHQEQGSLGYGIDTGTAFNDTISGITIERNIFYEWVGAASAPWATYGIGFAGDWTGGVGSTHVYNNTFYASKGYFINSDIGLNPLVGYSGNTYYRGGDQAADHFRIGGQLYADSQWPALTEPNAQFARPNYVDPNRTIKTYMSSLGRTPTTDAFLAAARAQERWNWNAAYTSPVVNDYIRAGFVTTGPATPITLAAPPSPAPTPTPSPSPSPSPTPSPTPAPNSTDITTGLLAKYSFDGNANNSVDSSAATVTGAQFVSGKLSQALSFNGSTDYVTLANLNGITTGGDITVAAWVNSPAASGFNSYGQSDGDGGGEVVSQQPINQGWRLFFTENQLAWRGGPGGGGTVTCTAPSRDGWHHVVASENAGQVTLYIDGAYCGSGGTYPTQNPGASINIGAFTNYLEGYHFYGLIDDVRIYNRALSSSEVQALYSSGSVAQTSSRFYRYLSNLFEQFYGMLKSVQRLFD